MYLNSSSNTKEKKRKGFSDRKVEWASIPLDIDSNEGTMNDEPVDLQPQTTQYYDNQEDATYTAAVNDWGTPFPTHLNRSPTPLNRLVARMITNQSLGYCVY